MVRPDIKTAADLKGKRIDQGRRTGNNIDWTLKNIQRFMKLRNPKIGDINLERMIDESILHELEKRGFLEQAMSGKATVR